MKKLFLFSLLFVLIISACQPKASPPDFFQVKEVLKTVPEDYADVRFKDLSPLTGKLDEAKIKTFWFSTSLNRWPADAQPIVWRLLEAGKNPGLGVRALHAQGLTGKGITVAIIDQNLVIPADHPEFAGKLIQYRDFGTDQPADQSSMHGPAVTSLLVGKTIGTAPDARLFYAAAPSWKTDAKYYADALNWLVDENTKLPAADKIRVVSVSAAPSGPGSEFKNGAAWDAAVQRATQAGILVLDCTGDKGLTVPCYSDLADPENPAKCTFGYPGQGTEIPSANRIAVPTSLRTQAEEYSKGQVGYQFTGQGGLSWSVPYLSGVLALGWQLRPDLTGQQMIDLIFQSAAERDGVKIINPPAFIELVKKAK